MELKQRYFEDYCSDNQYAVSIKEDMAYLCLHSPKTTETRSNTLQDFADPMLVIFLILTGSESVSDTAYQRYWIRTYLVFLEVRDTLISSRIILFPYILNTRIAFPGYGVLDLFPLWSLRECSSDTLYLPLMVQRIGCQNS
ncbi:hypothetical protein Tco_0891338 [Tanacetum coccineum]|uniref:Uncharacterized protein n=1 Tax=Tanacetum coccineum TaxID=301880 RepID=A0ABQ5C2Z4_9ASTR